jgi:uncharacterized protein YgfB (UPF0149 family)
MAVNAPPRVQRHLRVRIWCKALTPCCSARAHLVQGALACRQSTLSPGPRAPRVSTFAEQLWFLPTHLSEAALHGTTCGVLCGAPRLSAEAYRRALAGLLEQVDEMADEELERFVTLAAEDLDAPDLEFAPLLAGPDASLTEALGALVQWADGFVAGFEDVGGELEEDLLEAFDDIVAIAEADIESIDEDDAADLDLETVGEHLKVAVLTIRAAALSADEEPDDDPE